MRAIIFFFFISAVSAGTIATNFYSKSDVLVFSRDKIVNCPESVKEVRCTKLVSSWSDNGGVTEYWLCNGAGNGGRFIIRSESQEILLFYDSNAVYIANFIEMYNFFMITILTICALVVVYTIFLKVFSALKCSDRN